MIFKKLPDRMPQVTLVVPAYNHAAYLAQAIDSVLRQDYSNIELIVLDDGSTDGTRAVLERYGSDFHWESHANIGQAATLNKGWGMSHGEILGYLSADDYLLPGAVSALVAVLMAQVDAAVAYCDFYLVDPSGNLVRNVATPEFSLDDMLTKLACPPGPGALFRRSAYEAAGGWDNTLRQIPDFDFWLRMAPHGTFARIPHPFSAWRVHEGSQSFGPVSPERAAESVRVISAFFSAPGLTPAIAAMRPRALARAHLFCAQLHARSGRYRAALSNFSAVCRLHPGAFARSETWRSVANALFSQLAHRVLWRLRQIAGSKA